MQIKKPIPEKLAEEFKEYMNAANKNSPVGTGWYAHLETAAAKFMNSRRISGDVTEAVTQYFLMGKNITRYPRVLPRKFPDDEE